MTVSARPRATLLEGAGLSALLAAGIALRLGHALRGGLWRDEAQLLNVVKLPALADIFAFLGNHESHPPLYYLLVRGWTSIASSGDTAVVLPGITLGALTILLAWWAGRSLGSPATGWTAGALVALSPRLIEADSTVRPYSLLALVLLASTLALWTALERGSRRALAAWSAGAVVLLYTHNWSLLPVAAGGLVAMGFVLAKRSTLSLAALVAAGAAVILCWAPWLPSVFHQSQHGGQLPTVTSPLVRVILHAASSVPGLTIETGVVLVAGLVCTLALGRNTSASRDDGSSWLRLTGGIVGVALVAATLASFKTNLLVRHTLTMLSPVVLVGVALVFTRPDLKGALLARTALVLILALAARDAAHMALTPRSNVKELARFIAAGAGPGDLVLLTPGDLSSSFERYYRGSAAVFGYPEGSLDRPVRYDDRIVRETRPAILRAGADRVMSVLDSGGRVWDVSVGLERHLDAAWLELREGMREVAGVPATDWPGNQASEATLEHARLRVWVASPRGTGR